MSNTYVFFQDVTDLFGADLPVEGGEAGQFVWRDGPLLKALKAGHWVVLDEVCCNHLIFSSVRLPANWLSSIQILPAKANKDSERKTRKIIG